MSLRSSGVRLLSFLSRSALSAQRRSLSPHPYANHDFYGRREDQRAKRRLLLMTNSKRLACRTGKSPGLVRFFTSSQRDKELSCFALKEREMV
jgi:hypothetical protein